MGGFGYMHYMYNYMSTSIVYILNTNKLIELCTSKCVAVESGWTLNGADTIY